MDSVPSDQRGLAVATYFTGFDLGISIGPAGLGALGQAWGFGVMWPIAAACCLLGLLGVRGGRGHRARG